VRYRLPPRLGFLACRIVLTQPHPGSLIDALCAHYAKVPPQEWQQRFAASQVMGAGGAILHADQPFRAPLEVHYYRDFSEQPIPVTESIIYQDERLVVVDKPHFLPVHPAGKYRDETLVVRMIARTGNAELSPLHRLDRATAGLVLCSAQRESRIAYQLLFRDRSIRKRYLALAPALPDLAFPHERHTRLQRCDDGFRSEEVPGEPNALTRIDVLDSSGPIWRYALYPHTGQMHQLRVHMAALGAPIVNDPWYPLALPSAADDYARPLQLLAEQLSFIDPIDGIERSFCSGLRLAL
jgi:tRNA pseudouridine32 synthase/23S rRNA pseudouridine746 synthase